MLKTTNTTADVAAAILNILAHDAQNREHTLKTEMRQTPANDDSKRRTMSVFFDNSPTVTQKPVFAAPTPSYTVVDTKRSNATEMTSGKPAARLHDFRMQSLQTLPFFAPVSTTSLPVFTTPSITPQTRQDVLPFTPRKILPFRRPAPTA